MNIALRYALRGMAEERPDRELRETKIAGDAAKRMSQRMRRDANNADARAQTGQTGFRRREMSIADIGRKDVGTALPKRLAGSSSAAAWPIARIWASPLVSGKLT